MTENLHALLLDDAGSILGTLEKIKQEIIMQSLFKYSGVMQWNNLAQEAKSEESLQSDV